MEPARHDEYGKRLVRAAAGDGNVKSGFLTRVDLGGGGYAHIDCTVGNDIAVEVESRTSKQVRGAVMDLICHSYPKKLLVLLPVHMGDAAATKQQCEFLLYRFVGPENSRVVLCEGTGRLPDELSDTEKIRDALNQLGFSPKMI